MRERLWMAITPGALRTRVVVVNEVGKNEVLARLPPSPAYPHAVERLSEALALWCGRPVRVVLAVQGPEAFCSTRRWLATFEYLTRRPLVEIEIAEALQPPAAGGFAEVRRMLLARMARG
jgi:hypothetical protein